MRPMPSNTPTALVRMPSHTESLIESVSPTAAWVSVTRASITNTVIGRSAKARRITPPTSPVATPWAIETKNTPSSTSPPMRAATWYGLFAVPENHSALRCGEAVRSITDQTNPSSCTQPFAIQLVIPSKILSPAQPTRLSNGEVTKLHRSSNGLPIGNISPHPRRLAASQRPRRRCPSPPGASPWRSVSDLQPP